MLEYKIGIDHEQVKQITLQFYMKIFSDFIYA